jgi:ADP-heptose:LPS heptosyltransferase
MDQMNHQIVFDLKRSMNVHSILLIRLFALGDIALTLPLVELMRKSFPNAWMGYLVKERFAESLSGNTGLDEIMLLPESIAGQISTLRSLRKRRVDVAIDLLSSPRSALLTRLCGSGLRIGMDTGRRNGYYNIVLPRALYQDGERVKCYTIDSNLMLGRMLGLDAEMEEFGTDIGDRPFGFPAAERADEYAASFEKFLGAAVNGLAGIVPGTTYRSKGWPIDRFVELSERMSSELDLRPVVLWGPGERSIAEFISSQVEAAVMAPELGIAEMGGLIARMKILIGIDSGPKHLAVLLGIPTVTLFGPTDPRIWDPMNSLHRIIWKALECSEGCREKDCDPNRCMEMITVDEVYEEIKSTLGGRQ